MCRFYWPLDGVIRHSSHFDMSKLNLSTHYADSVCGNDVKPSLLHNINILLFFCCNNNLIKTNIRRFLTELRLKYLCRSYEHELFINFKNLTRRDIDAEDYEY